MDATYLREHIDNVHKLTLFYTLYSEQKKLLIKRPQSTHRSFGNGKSYVGEDFYSYYAREGRKEM